MEMRKDAVIIVLSVILCAMCGCGGEPQTPPDMPIWEGAVPLEEKDIPVEDQSAETEKIVAAYRDIYEEAVEANILGSLDTVRSIVSRLGGRGYVAVDIDNQVDMTGAEQAEAFCRAVDAREEAELTILAVTYTGGFRKFDLSTEAGKVDVVRGDYYFDPEGNLTEKNVIRYPADIWEYTEDGYLLLAGSYFSDENYILTLSHTPEHMALRVQPLDERCRELNRRYIMPVGYGKNNLFLTDWSEEDLGSLDFYDLFDSLYPICRGQAVPYVMDGDLRVGAVYRIPGEEFESVLTAYLDIGREKFRERTGYIPEDDTYEYRPRGFEEAEYPDIPYPEVVSYEEKEDGTIVMTVHAVFPNDNTSRAFAHEVVVRPREDGGFAYVSNRMLTPWEDCDLWWHSDRLTAEQWEEIYWEGGLSEERESQEADGGEGGLPGPGESQAVYNGEDCLLDQEERAVLEGRALAAAEQVKEVYRDVETDPTGRWDGNHFTREQCKQVTAMLGAAGYVSVTEDTDMENYEEVEAFYAAYEEGREAVVTLYDVYLDGRLGVITFAYREGRLQTYFVEIGWQGGEPEIRNTSVSDLAEICLTEKGYFIYAYEDVAAHASLRQYWRIRPLSDKCRELRNKYVFGLRYLEYDILTTDWDSGNVEDILVSCMFGDIYHIVTGENLQLEDGRIPGELFEGIMTTCFPVSKEQLRAKCGYDQGSDSYPFEMIFASFSAPFGEVVDYVENPDGTISLSVAGVWIENNTDCAFQSKLVIQPFADGTFRYLSNTMNP